MYSNSLLYEKIFFEETHKWLVGFLSNLEAHESPTLPLFAKLSSYLKFHTLSNNVMEQMMIIIELMIRHFNLSSDQLEDFFEMPKNWEVTAHLMRHCLNMLMDITITHRDLSKTVSEFERKNLKRAFDGDYRMHKPKESECLGVMIRTSLLNLLFGLTSLNFDIYKTTICICENQTESRLLFELNKSEKHGTAQSEILSKLVENHFCYPLKVFLKKSGLPFDVPVQFGSPPDATVILDPLARYIRFGELYFYCPELSSFSVVATALPLEDGICQHLEITFNEARKLAQLEIRTRNLDEWQTVDIRQLALFIPNSLTNQTEIDVRKAEDLKQRLESLRKNYLASHDQHGQLNKFV